MLRVSKIIQKFSSAKPNPFKTLQKKLNVGSKEFKFFSLPDLKDSRISSLPYSIRVLLESAIRNCDEFNVKQQDVEKILDWQKTSKQSVEIPFKPARVLLQDFTGVPAICDLAAMRDAMVRLKKNPSKINPACPVDLVIDHSVQADISRVVDAYKKNEEIEFDRNRERFEFLKWGQQAFDNLLIVPSGSGIVHQVNLEYLARVVFQNKEGVLYPDSLVGADSHTTMINGLGVVGWGVGGIEAEAVMIGECISMVLPQVVGVKLVGQLKPNVTATDLVLNVTQELRKRGVVGKFVEFFGSGVNQLNLADRATIANMAPEYGATMGFFPIDGKTIDYLKVSGRQPQHIEMIEAYLNEQQLFKKYDGSQKDPVFSGDILEINLNDILPCVSGPKRPQDKVEISKLKEDFISCLTNKPGFKGYGLKQLDVKKEQPFVYQNNQYSLKHGSVVIAAITSCTNTSNPDSMIMAGLVAKKAVEHGLSVSPYIKTVLAPGSEVVTKYYQESGLNKYLDQLGFNLTGYGCMVCIGNTGQLDANVEQAIIEGNIISAGVLSGNRNFEARIHPFCHANYLASPPLVVAYALAGKVDIDFATEPIGVNKKGQKIFFKDIWPTRQEAEDYVKKYVKDSQFKDVYSRISKGTDRWNNLQINPGKQYDWKTSSTYIHNPPFFQTTTTELPEIKNIKNAYCLLHFGDSVTTDHISPAGKIANNSPAGKYLKSRSIEQIDFNTYGSRRGHDEIMARGTFANTKLINKLLKGKVGPQTVHIPSGKVLDVYDAVQEYAKNGQDQLIILAGKEYGSGSSRDWAAKGPYLLNIKVVIAESYERIHRTNLIGMGILPLQFIEGESSQSLGLTGEEQFTIDLNKGNLKIGQQILVQTNTGNQFIAKVRLDTDVEIEYFKNGGILQYVLRKVVQQTDA